MTFLEWIVYTAILCVAGLIWLRQIHKPRREQPWQSRWPGGL
jgi:hypothetical protein